MDHLRRVFGRKTPSPPETPEPTPPGSPASEKANEILKEKGDRGGSASSPGLLRKFKAKEAKADLPDTIGAPIGVNRSSGSKSEQLEAEMTQLISKMIREDQPFVEGYMEACKEKFASALAEVKFDKPMTIGSPTVQLSGPTKEQASQKFRPYEYHDPSEPNYSGGTCSKSYLGEGEFSGDALGFRKYDNGIMLMGVADAAGNKEHNSLAAREGLPVFMSTIEKSLADGVDNAEELNGAIRLALCNMHHMCNKFHSQVVLNFALIIPEPKTGDYLVVQINVGDTCSYTLDGDKATDQFPEPPDKDYKHPGGQLGLIFNRHNRDLIINGTRIQVSRMKPGTVLAQGSDGLSDNLSPKTLKQNVPQQTQEEFTGAVQSNFTRAIFGDETREIPGGLARRMCGNVMGYMTGQPINQHIQTLPDTEVRAYLNQRDESQLAAGKPDDVTVNVLLLPHINSP